MGRSGWLGFAEACMFVLPIDSAPLASSASFKSPVCAQVKNNGGFHSNDGMSWAVSYDGESDVPHACRCIGSPQHLKTRFGNHLELEVILFLNSFFNPPKKKKFAERTVK